MTRACSRDHQTREGKGGGGEAKERNAERSDFAVKIQNEGKGRRRIKKKEGKRALNGQLILRRIYENIVRNPVFFLARLICKNKKISTIILENN